MCPRNLVGDSPGGSSLRETRASLLHRVSLPVDAGEPLFDCMGPVVRIWAERCCSLLLTMVLFLETSGGHTRSQPAQWKWYRSGRRTEGHAGRKEKAPSVGPGQDSVVEAKRRFTDGDHHKAMTRGEVAPSSSRLGKERQPFAFWTCTCPCIQCKLERPVHA